MIPDLLERQAAVEQIRGTGVAEGMRSALGTDDLQAIQQAPCQTVYPVASEWAMGRTQSQKHLATIPFGSSLLEILIEGLAHPGRHGIFLHPGGLATAY